MSFPRLKPGYLGNQNNARYPLPDGIPEETVCLKVHIPKSLYWYTVFWNQLFELAKWTAYEYDDDKNATVVATEIRQRLLEAKSLMPLWTEDSDLECEDCPPIPPVEIITEIIEICGGIVEIEGEEDMSSRLYIHKVNGVPYLADDCGCGRIDYYKMQSVQVNPETGAIGEPYDQIPNDTLPVDPGEALDCYWLAASNVIIGQISAFVDGLAQYFITPTLQAFIGTGVEAAQVVNAILSGNANLNFTELGITNTEVKSALTSQGYRDWLAGKLEERSLDGSLTRWNLGRLTQFEVPSSFSIPTPIAPYINYWGLFANLGELNNLLSQAATQCRTGINPSVADGWEVDLTAYGSIAELPFTVYNDGSNDWGALEPFIGMYPVNVGQLNIAITLPMNAGVGITDVGYRLASGSMGGNPFLRSLCGFDVVTCSGAAVNVSGFGELNVASPSTVTDGARLQFNALNNDTMRFDRFRIKFDTPVNMPIGWTPYEFV